MRSLFPYYWGAAFMLLPLYVRFNEFNDVRVNRNYFLYTCIIISAVCFSSRSIRSVRNIWPLLALLVLNFLFMESFYQFAAIEQLTIFSASILLISQIMGYQSKDNTKSFINFFKITALIQSAIVYLNWFGFNPYNPTVPLPYATGSLGQESLTAAFLGSLSPVFLYGNKRWLIAFPAAALLMLNTTFGFASLLFGLGSILLFKRLSTKAAFTIVFTGIIGCFVLGLGLSKFEFFNDKGRFDLWINALDSTKQWNLKSILFGKGIGNSYYELNQYKDIEGKPFTYFHNEYLSALWAFGVSGCFLLWKSFKPLLKVRYNEENIIFLSILCALMVNSVGNFTLHVAPIGLTFIIVYGTLISHKNMEVY